MSIEELAKALAYKTDDEINQLCIQLKEEYGITAHIYLEVDRLDFLRTRRKVQELEQERNTCKRPSNVS